MVGVAISTRNSESADLPLASAEHLNSANLMDLKTETKGNDQQNNTEQQVPVIDMAVLQQRGLDDCMKMRMEMTRACETWGFFQLINHGIDTFLLDEVREVSKGFFKESEEEKLEYKVKPGVIEGFYSSKLTAVGSNKLTQSVDHLYLLTSPPSRKNLDRWPRNPSAYRETMTQYAEQLRAVAEKLMCILSEELGLEGAVLLERMAGSSSGAPTQSIRTNFYTPTAASDPDESGSSPADDVLQLNAHSDPGGLTVLLQNDVSGFEVKKDDKWVRVEPIPNAFVVNIGDQIEMLSNGRYKSIEHRGVAHRKQERLSLATFYSPNYDAVIGPVEELINASHPALYKSIKYKDYFSMFVLKGLNGKEHVRAAIA